MSLIQLSHRMYSISDIKRLLKSKEIVLQPKYQRRRTAWPITAKTGLMDTIINNYPIQPIYLREVVNESNTRVKEIIDGQQRISTILEFTNDQFPLYKNFLDGDYKGYLFSELPTEMQNLITDYELSFISIKHSTESDIISIFSRINSFTLPLNKQEKRNALYAGEFKSLVYRLSSNYIKFWTDYRIYTDSAIARMKDAEFVSEILSLLIVGFSAYSLKKIEDSYKKYDQDFSNRKYYYNVFNNVMSVIGTLFQDNSIREHFRKQSWFFTLFLALYEKMYGEIKTENIYKRKEIDEVKILNGLLRLINDYKTGKFDERIRDLYQQGTNSTKNRMDRHSNMLKYMK